jgi:hypothetical protein
MAFGNVFRNFTSILRADGFAFRQRRKLGLTVINKTGLTIAVDKLVAISGYDVTSKLPKVVLADADGANLSTDVFVTTRAISDGKTALVFKGALSAANLNTNAASAAGDPVYLSTTAGGFTVTAPTAVNARTQIVGYVQVKSATVGQIAWDIQPSSRLGTQDLNGVGFATGAGGAVTQITNSSTGVTLSTLTGQITTVALTTAAGAEEKFTVTNTLVAATDVIVLSTTYNGAGGPVFLSAQNVTAGAFDLCITNSHASAALNAVMVINFVVIKGAAA